MKAGCGPCNLCCRLLHVPDIHKPSGMLCWWTGMHGGCQRHAEKDSAPELAACAQFQCVYLQSQDRDDPGERAHRGLRPDTCHVVLGPQDPEDSTLLYVQVDPEYPDAWRKEPVFGVLQSYLDKGAKLEVIIGEVRVRLPDETYDGGASRGILH